MERKPSRAGSACIPTPPVSLPSPQVPRDNTSTTTAATPSPTKTPRKKSPKKFPIFEDLWRRFEQEPDPLLAILTELTNSLKDNAVASYRSQRWSTAMGTLYLLAPHPTAGSYHPFFLQCRQRFDTALLAGAQEALTNGVSTPKSRRLLEKLDVTGAGAAELARVTHELDQLLLPWRTRPLDDQPIVWIDTLMHPVWRDGQKHTVPLAVAMGTDDQGRKAILAVEPLPPLCHSRPCSEPGAGSSGNPGDAEGLGQAKPRSGWREFFTTLRARGVQEMGCVVADAHAGLRQALADVFPQTVWQHCTVCLTRAVLAPMPQGHKSLMEHQLEEIFSQPTHDLALRRAALVLRAGKTQASETCKLPPQACTLLRQHLPDALHFHRFGDALGPDKRRSITLLQRVTCGIRRRARALDTFPSEAAFVRLYAAALMELHEDWRTQRALVDPHKLIMSYKL